MAIYEALVMEELCTLTSLISLISEDLNGFLLIDSFKSFHVAFESFWDSQVFVLAN